jgi:CheY-like chemotaxis protein
MPSILVVDDAASMRQMVAFTLRKSGCDLTTESGPAKKAEGKAAGATGWLVKPFRPEELVAAVKKAPG